MSTASTVKGQCTGRFEGVRKLFEDDFARGEEVGAAFAVFCDDELVVDLWGGLADNRAGVLWERETTCPVFSITKSITATAALLLADRQVFDLDAPVIEWWPEYGYHGKDGTTAVDLLSHQAGLPYLETRLGTADGADAEKVADLLAAQAPVWQPGSAHGYHALTYGWLVGEIVRRHTGMNVGEFVAAEICGPRGLNVLVGAPLAVVEKAAKVGAIPDTDTDNAAPVEPPAHMRVVAERFADPTSLVNLAFASPAAMNEPSGYNNPAVLTTGWPAIGGLASASGLAGLYRDLVGGRILSTDLLRRATAVTAAGVDRVFGIEDSFGLGYMLHRPPLFYAPDQGAESAFGHIGAGGAFVLGDLDRGLSVAYLPNGTRTGLADFTRGYPLLEAVYEAL